MTAILFGLTGAVLAVCGGLGLWVRRTYVVVSVEGPSMEPTYWHGDRVLVRRAPMRLVRTGQVVVVRRPAWADDAPDRWLIKRAAAVPDEPVPDEVREAVISTGVAPGPAGAVAGVTRPIGGAAAAHVVPAGCLVVLGDNRTQSADSRHWGYVTEDRLLGTVRRTMIRAPRPE